MKSKKPFVRFLSNDSEGRLLLPRTLSRTKTAGVKPIDAEPFMLNECFQVRSIAMGRWSESIFSEELPDIAERCWHCRGHFATAICVNNLMDAERNQFGL